MEVFISSLKVKVVISAGGTVLPFVVCNQFISGPEVKAYAEAEPTKRGVVISRGQKMQLLSLFSKKIR